ncbi:MAG: HAMP domain-containing protein, partial [Candidatus Tectomicrobia bacterium]
MRRLYLQIYVAFLGILLLFGVLVSIAWLLIPTNPQHHLTLDGIGAVLGELLPGPDRPVDELQAALARLGNFFPAHLTVRGADGVLLAVVGSPLPAPPSDQTQSGWMRSRGAGPTIALLLSDGRWVVVRWLHHHGTFGWLGALGLLATAIALGAYPIVRRITRRLERLQARVDALGAGDLATRVEVEGN